METQTSVKTLELADIQAVIPHRYPFLLVDRVEILQEDKKAVGTKCVTGNEEFFQGHFPGHPIMPGVLIVEALAQTACVLMFVKPEFKGKIAYFLGIEEAKFRQPVKPGQVLKLQVEVLRMGSRAGKVKAEAYVQDTLVTEGILSFAIVDK
ncbi:MAG: 3-hydroxyacyl-ACP dehydratase FabZ [Elusimicrobia bacterium]|nr:3-hydroxyacyl-ACP dehydratase FabZ [Elusimicrobiota bacterium]